MADIATSKSQRKRNVFTGTFVHTPSLGKLDLLQDAVVGVEDGIIRFVEEGRRRGHDGMPL